MKRFFYKNYWKWVWMELKGFVFGDDHCFYTIGFFAFGYFIGISRNARIDMELNNRKGENPFYFIFCKDEPSRYKNMSLVR